MSNKIKQKKSKWGGRREGAGVKGRIGGTEKFSVSVTKAVWQDALKIWSGTRSGLVDHSLRLFVEREAAI
jgi:hypothetical protein